VEEDQSPETVCLAALATIPIDKLSARLQHLDHCGGSLAELTQEHGLLEQCQKQYFSLLQGLYPTHPDMRDRRFEALDQHLSSPAGFASRVRGIVLRLAAMVWGRMEVKVQNFPWKLIATPSMTRARRQQVFHVFFDAPPCELDELLSEWLRAGLQDAGDLDGLSYRLLFVALGRFKTGTNMLLEGLLNQIRQSVMQSKKKPTPEKICHLGLLTQLMRRHCDLGSPNGCSLDFAALAKQGVPLQVIFRGVVFVYIQIPVVGVGWPDPLVIYGCRGVSFYGLGF
jgi:hypothetical protein